VKGWGERSLKKDPEEMVSTGESLLFTDNDRGVKKVSSREEGINEVR